MALALHWIVTPITTELVRGCVELEQTAAGVRPHRLPLWARKQWPDQQLLIVEGQPSGVRLAFRTQATAIQLDTLPTKRVYIGMPLRPDGVYDVRIDGLLMRQGSVNAGNVQRIDTSRWTSELEPGSPGTLAFVDLPAGVKDIEIWLPHDEVTELIALRSDAPLELMPAVSRKLWLHHGSSISHGSNAESPTGTWPAIAASRADVDLFNLGFGGGALLDPFTARTIRDLDADVISLKLGINMVNADVMRLRAFGPAVHGFLDTIRDGHPTTPLLVVSPILCPIHEDTPGPSAPDFVDGQLKFRATGDASDIANGKLTLNVIRATLQNIVEQRSDTDSSIFYLDGRELYGEVDHALNPLPDNLHPSAATHGLIGDRFAELAFSRSAPLGSTKNGD
jgi:hypothetical protein